MIQIQKYGVHNGIIKKSSILQTVTAVLMVVLLVAGVVVSRQSVQANQSLAQWEIDGFSSLAGGSNQQCGLSQGQPYCWGYDTTFTNYSLSPTLLNSNGLLTEKNTTSIASGQNHYCLVADNQPYCSGANADGQIGNGTITAEETELVAVDTSGVLAGKTITAVAVGRLHSCAIASGNVYCWGGNGSGQLGNNSFISSSLPVAVDTSGVLAGKTITNLSVPGSGSYSCVAASGKAYCWGGNGSGQLGNNSTTDSSLPVAVDTSGVLAGKTITAVSTNGATGQFHTCAVASGKAYCWGSNAGAQLGTSSVAVSSSVPVAVDASGVLAGKTITALAGGGITNCVIANSSTYCWGKLTGDGTTYRSYAPVQVVSVVSQPTITSVDFTTISGKKTMNVHGNNLSLLSAETPAGLSRSLVTLDDEPLKFCTSATFDSATLLSLGVSTERFSDAPKCYFYVDNTGFIDTRYLYQIWVPDDFDITAAGTVQVEGSNIYAYNAPDDTDDPGNGDHENPTFIINLPPHLTVTTNTGTNLENTGTTSDHSIVQLKTSDGTILAEIPVNTSVDRDWSNVTAGIDLSAKKAFVHGLATAPGSESSTFTLFVPKALNDTAVIICPGAASLADVRKDCPSAVMYTSADQNVSIVTIDGKQYWKVAGLTGTGGMSVLGAAIGAPNTGFADNAFTDKVNGARFPYVMYSALFVIAAIVFLGSKFMILRKKNNDTKL